MENDPTLWLYQIAPLHDTKIKIISHESSIQDEQETFQTFLRNSNGLDTIEV